MTLKAVCDANNWKLTCLASSEDSILFGDFSCYIIWHQFSGWHLSHSSFQCATTIVLMSGLNFVLIFNTIMFAVHHCFIIHVLGKSQEVLNTLSDESIQRQK